MDPREGGGERGGGASNYGGGHGWESWDHKIEGGWDETQWVDSGHLVKGSVSKGGYECIHGRGAPAPNFLKK